MVYRTSLYVRLREVLSLEYKEGLKLKYGRNNLYNSRHGEGLTRQAYMKG